MNLTESQLNLIGHALRFQQAHNKRDLTEVGELIDIFDKSSIEIRNLKNDNVKSDTNRIKMMPIGLINEELGIRRGTYIEKGNQQKRIIAMRYVSDINTEDVIGFIEGLGGVMAKIDSLGISFVNKGTPIKCSDGQWVFSKFQVTEIIPSVQVLDIERFNEIYEVFE